MPLVMLSYNVRADDTDYEDLFAVIRALGPTWHDGSALDSVWFLATTQTVDQVDAALSSVMTRRDRWFIVDITGMRRQGLMPQTLWEWLDAADGGG